MSQQRVELIPQTIEMIREMSHQKWRDCQRKDYFIYAIKAPAGYIFANKLEQPLSYKAICRVNNGNPIISIQKIERNPKLVEYVKQNGFYKTDGSRIVLCGTVGELWDVKPEKLVSSYTMPDGSPIEKLPDGWFVIKRASETRPNSVGIQLPIQFHGIYQTSWAMLHVNDINSGGHGSGDILVAPKMPDGSPDYSNISPTNNEVFALTYNQNVGGWNRTKNIIEVGNIKPLTIEYVKEHYVFEAMKNKVGGDLDTIMQSLYDRIELNEDNYDFLRKIPNSILLQSHYYSDWHDYWFNYVFRLEIRNNNGIAYRVIWDRIIDSQPVPDENVSNESEKYGVRWDTIIQKKVKDKNDLIELKKLIHLFSFKGYTLSDFKSFSGYVKK